MNSLTKFVTESILSEEVENEVVIYSGRFQPFHPGHYGVYKHLVKKFGKENVYIGTSDKTDPKKSPLKFKEKHNIITSLFPVPKDKVVQVKNPYTPVEVLKKYNPENTAYIAVVGRKDINRLKGKYFDDYDKHTILQGYKDAGYVYAAPMMEDGISASQVRHAFSKIHSEEEHQEYFKKIYGKFNKRILKTFQKKFKEFTNPVKIKESTIQTWIEERFPSWLNEVNSSSGDIGADDGPTAFASGYDHFEAISKRRAERIGWEVIKQIADEELYDITEFPEYPDGPIDAVSSFPAGVIGKLTAMNQRDFEEVEAYEDWYDHVTRAMALAGYEIIKFNLTGQHTTDDMQLSIQNNQDIEDDPAVEDFEDNMRVDELKHNILSDEEINEIADDFIKEFGLRMGYPSKEEYEKKVRDVKKLQDKLVADREEDKEYTPVKESKNFDDKEFYLEYYKNLTPSGREVVLSGEDIIISKTSNSLSESRSSVKRDTKPFVIDLEKITEKNQEFRRIIWTGGDFQLVVMSIQPGEDIGLEKHDFVEQFVRVESGTGIVQLGHNPENMIERELEDDYAVMIPTGYYHNFICREDDEPLKVYIMYSQPKHGVTGESVNEDIQNLGDSLGIDRSKMPQINSEDYTEFAEWLINKNINVAGGLVSVSKLKPAQKHFDDDKVKNIIDDDRSSLDKPIWITSDNYILDGMHRAIAAFNIEGMDKIKAYRIGKTFNEVLEIVKEFPKVHYKNIAQ